MERYRFDSESMKWKVSADGVRFKAYEQSGGKIVMAPSHPQQRLKVSHKATLFMSWKTP